MNRVVIRALVPAFSLTILTGCLNPNSTSGTGPGSLFAGIGNQITGSGNGSSTGTPNTSNSSAGVQAFQKSFYAFATAQNSCVQCHGSVQSPLFAVTDVNVAYNNAKPFANFANPANSLLVQYAGNGHCGLSSCTNNSAAALAAVTTWAAAETMSGTPTTSTGAINVTAITDSATLMAVATDLTAQPAAAQPYLRYFTLEAYGNATTPLVAIDVERAALIKMINLLSTAPAIVQPTAVDANKLIYRIDMRSVKWATTAWTNMKAADPYFPASEFSATMATAANQTVRADWFVANIANSQIGAYFQFLGINSDDPTIDGLNGVNRWADMTAGAPAIFRVGMAVSNTEPFNRIVEWHATNSLGSGVKGHLFKSYNFDNDVGTSDIFSHPYEPTANNPSPTAAYNGMYNFVHADSDNIFTLPNGLNGYYTTEGTFNGQVESVNNVGTAFPGPAFCFQCHDTKTNMIPMTDVMRAALMASGTTFPSALQSLLVGMYSQTDFNGKMAAAGQIFASAYASLNLPVPESVGIATETMNIVTNSFSVVVGINMAAAELGVTPAQLIAAIKGSSTLSLSLSSLITVDANNMPNGQVRRDLWETWYAQVRYALFPTLPAPSPVQ